jgi:hypothetical protein
LSSGEESRLAELEAKLARGERLTAAEEAELNRLRARFKGKTGLNMSEEDRLKELEEKIRRGIPLTALVYIILYLLCCRHLVYIFSPLSLHSQSQFWMLEDSEGENQ